MTTPIQHTCLRCHKNASAVCACCHTVYYCSPKCQRSDYVYHKHEVIAAAPESITTPLNAGGDVEMGDGSPSFALPRTTDSSSTKVSYPERRLVKVRESTLQQIRTMNELVRQIRQATANAVAASGPSGEESAETIESRNRFLQDLTDAKHAELLEFEAQHLIRMREWSVLFDKTFDQDAFVTDFYADFMRQKQELSLSYTLAHLTGNESQLRRLHHKRDTLIEYYNERVFEGWLLRGLMADPIEGPGESVSLLEMYQAVRGEVQRNDVETIVGGLTALMEERVIEDVTAFFRRRQLAQDELAKKKTTAGSTEPVESMQSEDDDDDYTDDDDSDDMATTTASSTTTTKKKHKPAESPSTVTLKRTIDKDDMVSGNERHPDDDRRLKRERLGQMHLTANGDEDKKRAERAQRRSNNKGGGGGGTATKTTAHRKKKTVTTKKKRKDSDDQEPEGPSPNDRVLFTFEQTAAVNAQSDRVMEAILNDTTGGETPIDDEEEMALARRETRELVDQLFVEVDARMEREELLTVDEPTDPTVIMLKTRTRLFYETYKAKLQEMIDGNSILTALQSLNINVLPRMLLRGALDLLAAYAMMCLFHYVSSNTYPVPTTEELQGIAGTFIQTAMGNAQNLVSYGGEVMRNIMATGQLNVNQWAIVQLACLAVPGSCTTSTGRQLYNLNEQGLNFRSLVDHFSTTLDVSLGRQRELGNAGNVAMLLQAKEACVAYLVTALDTPASVLDPLRTAVLSSVRQLREGDFFSALGLDSLDLANRLNVIDAQARSLWHVVLSYGLVTQESLAAFNASITGATGNLTAQITALPTLDAPFVHSMLNGTYLEGTLRPGAAEAHANMWWSLLAVPLNNLGIAGSFMAQQAEYTATKIVTQYGLGGWLQALYQDGLNSMILLNGTQVILFVTMASVSLFGYTMRLAATGIHYAARLCNYLYSGSGGEPAPSEQELAYDAVWDLFHDDTLEATVKVARATELLQPYVTGADGLTSAFNEIRKRDTRARPDPRRTRLARTVNALNAAADATVGAVGRSEASDLLFIVKGMLQVTSVLQWSATFITVILTGLCQLQTWSHILIQIPFLPSPLALAGLTAGALFYLYGQRILQALPAIPLVKPALLLYQRLFRAHPQLTATGTMYMICTLQEMLRTFTAGDVSRVSWILDALLQPISVIFGEFSMIPSNVSAMTSFGAEDASRAANISEAQTQLALYVANTAYTLDPTIERLVSLYPNDPQGALAIVVDGYGTG